MGNKNTTPDSEKKIEKSLGQEIKKRKWLYIKLLPFEMAGLPDRMILGGGRAYFAEIKTQGQKLRPIQKLIHKKFEQVGFKVWVIDSHILKNEFLEYLDNEQKRST